MMVVKEYGLDKCIELYEEYITKKGYNLEELKNKKLGCWCNLGSRCHVDVLLRMIRMKNDKKE
jgi:hypothetical protein